MNKTIVSLVEYVNAASDLAESLQSDIKKSIKAPAITDNTVLALSKFIAAAKAIKYLKDEMNEYTIKNN